MLRHNSRYSLLNEPIGEIEFVRNGSDNESIDQTREQPRSQSQENLSTIGKNAPITSPTIIVYEVDVYKDTNNSFGMSLMGDPSSGIFVKAIQLTDGGAARSRKIQAGDRLLSFNGKNVNGMSVQEIAQGLSLSPNPCRLKLSRNEVPTLSKKTLVKSARFDNDSWLQQQQQQKYTASSTNNLSATWSQDSFSKALPPKRLLSNESILSQASDLSATHDIKSAVFPVTIDKTGHNSLGFLVVGGLDSEIEDHGIYVKSITPGGAASKSNLLIEGDKILEVNGASLARVTHTEAVELFRRSPGSKCHLLVQRLIFPNNLRSSSTKRIYPFAHPENTFEVSLNRSPTGLGLNLAGGIAENRPIEILDIYPNQPAALSGRLNRGDIVLSINGISMHDKNVHDIPSIIGESTENVKLIICRPDRRALQAYLDRQMNSTNQSDHVAIPISVNNEHYQGETNIVRDLPPKSPNNRRIMPKIPIKVKRGEDQSGTSLSAPPSPVIAAKPNKPELLNKPVQYEKIEVSLPKANQGTYGIGLSQIDPQNLCGGIFICALQPNGIADKDGRLKIDDRLLFINDNDTERMSYREVVEALKATTKQGVKLIVGRPITDSLTTNKTIIVPNAETPTIKVNPATKMSTPTVDKPSIIERLIPLEKPILVPVTKPEQTQATTSVVRPNNVEISTSSSSSAEVVKENTAPPSSLPLGSALEALIGKRMKPLPSSNFETTTTTTNKNNQPLDIKKKDSPMANKNPEEDISEIKTPLISPQSPVAPPPVVLELKIPPTNAKSLSTSQANEIAKRKQSYQQAASNETLILNAGVTEKIENLTRQLIDKISTPAITMDTKTLMEECREIDMKIESDEYLEEFRALKNINEHEPIEMSLVAMQPENKALNRFQNIIPYDFNRVILSTKPDYINASHIAIPVGEKSMKYIICPPPVTESISDFWQMIAEQKIKCIVGIFSDQDLKKMKCPSYWPTAIKATLTLSPFLSITLIKSRQFDDGIDIKEFRIRFSEQSNQKQEHSIIFLTYTRWPLDDNIPHDTQSFLNIIHLAHSYQTGETSLLIHCNTGVGRTGCALLVSLLLIKMIRGETLDIYQMAKECRRQRCGIIQTEQQYRFIYDCARDALNMAIELSIMQSA